MVKTVDGLADAQLNLTKVTKVRLMLLMCCGLIGATYRFSDAKDF